MTNLILADTNKIFGMFRAMILQGSDLSSSPFAKYIRIHQVFVSTFILDELYRISLRYNIPVQDSHIDAFVHLLNLQVYQSKTLLENKYGDYVTDINDAQIVQDAVAIHATHIITSNTKDFITSKIKGELGISVVNSIEHIS